MLFLGTLPIADSQADLQINPGGLINDRLFCWNHNQVGAQTDFGSSYLIIGTYYLVMSALLPLWLVERLFFVLILFTAGYSLFILAKEFKLSKPSAFVAGVFFMYSYWLTTFFKGASVMVMAYAFCPLLLFLTVRGLKVRDYRYAILIGLLTCLFAGINPPEGILALAPSALYAIGYLAMNRDRFTLKFGGLVIVIGLLVNLFWIVPGVISQLSVFGQGVWEESPDLYNRFSSYPEVIRGLGYWGIYDGWNWVPYFDWAAFFLENPIGIILSYVVPACALLGLLSKRAREPKFILIAALMVLSIPLTVGAYPLSDPGATGTLYLWFYNNVPLFNAFRSSYKFAMLLTLSYALFFGLFLDAATAKCSRLLETRLGPKAKKAGLVKIAIVLIAVTTVMAAYWPAWTGHLHNDNADFNVPSYYNDVKNYFKDMPDKRIMLTPGRYYSVYEWGDTSLEVMDIILQNPLVYQNPGDANSSLPGVTLINSLYTAIYNNDTPAVPLMMRYLGIEYIVQQNDIDYKYYGANSPDEMRSILSSIKGLEHVATFGKLDVYHLNSTSGGSGIVEASSHILSTDTSQSVPIDRIFVNKALMETQNNITNWTDGASIYTRPLVGDYEVEAQVSITEGEKIGMALFFDEDDYYTFELSATASNVSGIGHYSRENLTSFSPHPYSLEYNTVQTITLKNEGGTVHFEVNGQSLGSVDIPEGDNSSQGPMVAFAAINAIGKMDWISIQDETFEIRDNFTISVCPELRNWNTIGGWVIGTSLTQYYAYDGEVPAFIYSSDSMASRLAGTALIDPEGLSYHEVNPANIEIQVNGSKGPFVLIMKDSYANWKLNIDGEEVPGSSHFLVNGYANGWIINRTGNFTIHASYVPQSSAELGLDISIGALSSVMVLMAATVVWPMVRKGTLNGRRK